MNDHPAAGPRDLLERVAVLEQIVRATRETLPLRSPRRSR
jgi:hypothetical protein